MAEPDYYALIGVDRSATLHQIRSNFRQKVLAEHPDKGGDPKKLQLLNKAYNVLTDQEKRRRYDSTGRTEKSVEEQFVEGFGGGNLHVEARSKDADEMAVVSLQDRIIAGPQNHEDGFNEWLRQRDQTAMVLTDKDFMKTHLFNATELATQVNHSGPVQHVLGSPKTDAYGQALGGAVAVQTKAKAMKKTLGHDEILVRMLAVPVDESMVYAELRRSGVCLGITGVGRIEQTGSRIEDLNTEDAVIILPKPTKYTAEKPIGTARTLVMCSEEDVIRVPHEILEELTPEQISLTPTIVCAYTVLEQYGAKLKPGDSVLLNAAHLSASGAALLQLCKLLKLKPLCLLSLPGAPKSLVRGEWGSKESWADADTRHATPATVRVQYERLSEQLVTMGAEEVFPDAVSLLRWRDRNQRMLPKLALDGIASKESCEQLVHCVQGGDKDSQLVVYGNGAAAPIDISPPLLAAWGGRINGFSIARWVHAVPANMKKMMAVMENITKLVRSNKFVLDCVLYKVGEDAITDAFSRAADPDPSQVVLIFPTLQEETQASTEELRKEQKRKIILEEQASAKRKEEEEREALQTEWLDLLFTDQSVAAMSPEGPLPIALEGGELTRPKSIMVWIGDAPKVEGGALRDALNSMVGAHFINVAWSQHPAAEAYAEFNLKAPEIIDGSWYTRSRETLENSDLDLLHDVEVLGRSLTDVLEPKLGEFGLKWNNVVLMGFGKGAGIALYATLLRLLPQPPGHMIFFSPVVPFPSFLGEKVQQMAKTSPQASPASKMFAVWGNRNRSTPGTYRQLLGQVLRKVPQLQCTPDTLPETDHSFDAKSAQVLKQLLQLCMPR